jgi:hypothetical protein
LRGCEKLKNVSSTYLSFHSLFRFIIMFVFFCLDTSLFFFFFFCTTHLTNDTTLLYSHFLNHVLRMWHYYIRIFTKIKYYFMKWMLFFFSVKNVLFMQNHVTQLCIAHTFKSFKVKKFALSLKTKQIKALHHFQIPQIKKNFAASLNPKPIQPLHVFFKSLYPLHVLFKLISAKCYIFKPLNSHMLIS